MSRITEVQPARSRNAATTAESLTPSQKKKRIAELREELAALESSEGDTFLAEVTGDDPAASSHFLELITDTKEPTETDADFEKHREEKILENKRKESHVAWRDKCFAAAFEAIKRGPSADDFLDDVTGGGGPSVRPKTPADEFLDSITY